MGVQKTGCRNGGTQRALIPRPCTTMMIYIYRKIDYNEVTTISGPQLLCALTHIMSKVTLAIVDYSGVQGPTIGIFSAITKKLSIYEPNRSATILSIFLQSTNYVFVRDASHGIHVSAIRGAIQNDDCSIIVKNELSLRKACSSPSGTHSAPPEPPLSRHGLDPRRSDRRCASWRKRMAIKR